MNFSLEPVKLILNSLYFEQLHYPIHKAIRGTGLAYHE